MQESKTEIQPNANAILLGLIASSLVLPLKKTETESLVGPQRKAAQ